MEVEMLKSYDGVTRTRNSIAVKPVCVQTQRHTVEICSVGGVSMRTRTAHSAASSGCKQYNTEAQTRDR